MSVEGKLGAKGHRKAEEAVGEPLHMAIATHHPWVEAVTQDDRHLRWNRTTGEVEQVQSGRLTNSASCPKTRYP